MADFMTPPADAAIAPSGPVWLDGSGILITITTTQVQTLQDAKENMKITWAAGNGIPRPLLIDISRTRAMSKEAREEYTAPESRKHITAVALLTNSNVGRMVGNLFINLNKHVVPIKLFTDPVKGRDWLLQYKVK